MTSARRILAYTEHVLMAETTTSVTVMQIMVAKTVRWNSLDVDHHPAKTMASAYLTWKKKPNTNSTALARMDFTVKLVRL